jgi:peroxiredoxin
MTEGLNRRDLAIGEPAPAFEFKDPAGSIFRSAELLEKGPVLLTFYRGAWCNCCQADLRDVVSVMPDLLGCRLTILGVFCGLSLQASERIYEEYSLDFPLVNDVGGHAAHAFGIRRSPEELVEIERELSPELLALKGGEPWILPMQARFVIDRGGRIARSEIIFDYAERCALKHLIAALKGAD